MKSFFFGSFVRTAIFITATASLPAMGIVTFAGMERNAFALRKAAEQVESTLRLAAETQEAVTADAKTLLSTLALTDPVQKRSVELPSLLESLCEQASAYADLSLDEDHAQSLRPSPGGPRSAPASRLGFASGIAPSPPGSDSAILYFTYHFVGGDNKDLSLSMEVRPEYYTHLFQQVNLLPGSRLYLLDMRWRQIFALSPFPDQAAPFRAEIGKAVEDRGTAEDLFLMKLGEERVLVAFERLFLEEENAPYLQAVYIVPEKTLLSAAASSQRWDFAFLVLAFAGTLALAVVLMRVVFSPSIQQLLSAAKAYGAGDYAFRPRLSSTCAEMRELGRSLTGMADALQRRENDLTHARDAALNADQSKSEFLANMGHEIRTPMNAIIGMAYLAMEGEISPRQRGYLVRIHESGTVLLRVINDILELARLDSGKAGMEAIPFAPREMFAECLRRFILPAREKELTLDTVIAKEVPHQVVGDPLHLGQILGHLLDNAVSQTDVGGITVNCTLEESTPSRVLLRISIVDTGPGMSKEREAALNRFFAGESAPPPEINTGKGVGLLLAQKVLSAMGGAMTVESRDGLGSTFTFRVNLGVRARKRTANLASLEAVRVLAVDDDPVTLDILRELLRNFRMRVEVEVSPEKTLDLLSAADAAHDPFHLVILDWRMPSINGVELARRIKGKTDLSLEPVVVMLSAYGWDGVVLQAEQAGVDAFLHKPLNESVLLDTILDLMPIQAVALQPDTERTPEENTAEFHGVRILVVEDNLINQQIAREILESAGVEVSFADNGKEALALFDPDARDVPYDMVLMDLQMPIMDGLEATRKLRTMRAPWAGDMPVIAMTAHSRDLEFEEAMEAGLNDHVSKPISVSDFFAALRRWLPLRPLEDRETAEAMRRLHSLLAREDSQAATCFDREKPVLLRHLFPGRVALLEERIQANDAAGAAAALRRWDRILSFMQGGSA